MTLVKKQGKEDVVKKWIKQRSEEAGLTGNVNKGLFGHIRKWFNNKTGIYNIAELQSDVYQKFKVSLFFSNIVIKYK